MRSEVIGPCDRCGKPVLTSDLRYTGGEDADLPYYRHWDCHQRRLDEYRAAVDRLPELERRVRGAIGRLSNILGTGRRR